MRYGNHEHIVNWLIVVLTVVSIVGFIALIQGVKK